MVRQNRTPTSTYRLQLNPDFTFAQAAAIAPYIADLGVSHVYLSPSLQAAPGSTHGYDVVDHSKANDELGGEDGFSAMIAAFHEAGLGAVLDVVPNHMAAVLPENRWWWDVLENGPSSFWAGFFDIDWDPPESTLRNRVLLPILGERYGRALDEGLISVAYDGRTFSVRYRDHVLPVSPRSLGRVLAAAASLPPEVGFIADALSSLPLAWQTDRASVARAHRDKAVLLDRVAALYRADPAVRAEVDAALAAVSASTGDLDAFLERQNYRLAFWRTAGEQLDYRRFFDIDSLVALRVEDPDVFEETHAHVMRWVQAGMIDGLRIDHVDGLADPTGYLKRLGDTWTVVEKILGPEERLPTAWPVAGTTGYDFLNVVTRLFVDPDGQEPLTNLWDERAPEPGAEFEDVARDGKELILSTSLAADLNRVVDRAYHLAEQMPAFRDVARGEVYEAVRGLVIAMPVYRAYGDHQVIESAAASVKGVDEDVLGLIVDLVEGDDTDLARRFEQLTGPVMAKGVEDTAFYRHHRLIALNEVGGEPAWWSVAPEEWHAWCAESAGGSMLASSTHDTKRSEDVRARLVLLSEMPGEWASAVAAWEGAADRYRTGEWPDRPTQYLMWQTFVGAWPLSGDRAVAYAEKATREAKVHTSWTDPNPGYDEARERWVRGVLGDADLAASIAEFAGRLVEPGRVVSLSQALCKLTAPGVPDIYQGCELWDLSLVDPDNRRPVDYDARAAALRDPSSEPKMRLTAAALDLRRRRPNSFAAGAPYAPVPASDGHAVAFQRGDDVVAVVPRLTLGGRGGGTTVDLPAGRWRDVITGGPVDGGTVAASRLFAGFPVALLEKLA